MIRLVLVLLLLSLVACKAAPSSAWKQRTVEEAGLLHTLIVEQCKGTIYEPVTHPRWRTHEAYGPWRKMTLDMVEKCRWEQRHQAEGGELGE